MLYDNNKKGEKMKFKKIAASAALAIGAAISTAIPAQADVMTDAYLMVLDEQGITFPSDGVAIAAGFEVCDHLDMGLTALETATEVYNQSGLNPYDSGFLVGAAISAFCPEYNYMIPSSATASNNKKGMMV